MIQRQDKQVIKSPNDKNVYYTNVLPNGMKYMIISDVTGDKSAASLNVDIGSLHDPLDFLGLAHFLEHSILLGTDKYPNKNEFSDFMAKNSGSSNAYTTTDSTNFHFDVCNEEFTIALDMFSQFFISPTFSEDLIQRELEAVDSEFKMDFRNDQERIANLIVSEGDKESPFSKFQCGNMTTLSKPNIRERVIRFYREHYTPAKMTLCVMSNKSIEELNALIIHLFSSIHPHVEYIELSQEKRFLYTENNMGYLYKLIPIQTRQILEFYWVINFNEYIHYKEQPCNYIVSILGHEGKNSLTSLLRKKELILGLSSEYSIKGNTYTEITMSIDLTQKGLNNYKEIITIVLGFISKLKTIDLSENFYNELKQCAETDFLFFEKEEPIDFCIEIAENLSLFPAEEAITVSSLYSTFSPDIIKKYLHAITTSQLNIYLIATENQKEKEQLGKIFSIEEYYQAEYIKEKIDFSTYDVSLSKEENDALDYPIKNIFIPKELDLIDYNKYNIHTTNKFPEKIVDNTHIVWYKPDIVFKIPKCYLSAHVDISNQNLDINMYLAYSQLWMLIMEEELSEELYMGELAGNSFSCYYGLSVLVSIAGFSDSIEQFVKSIVHKMKIISSLKNIDRLKTKLEAKLEDLIKHNKNEKLGNVDAQARNKLMKFLKNPTGDNDKLLSIYEKLLRTIKEKGIEATCLQNFIYNCLKKTKFEWLIQGNILPDKALNIISIVEQTLGSSDIPKCNLLPDEIRKFQIVDISPLNTLYYQFVSEDKENENNCLISYIQIGNCKKDLRSRVLIKLILEIFEEDFFYELRTEQKLGYHVSIEQFKVYDVMGLICFIQSTVAHPEQITQKVDQFFLDYDLNDEEEFTDEEYNQYANSLITHLKEKHLSLSEEFCYNFGLISTKSYQFNIIQEMIDLIEKDITKKDVIEFFNQYIYKKIKRIDIEVIGKNHLNTEPMEIDEDDKLPSITNRIKINNHGEFHGKNKYYEELFY